MQPKIITLPDEIRDALERDFPGAPKRSDASYPNMDETIARNWIANILFPYDAPEHLRTFLIAFQEDFTGLSTGSRSPLILLRNLPERSGKYLKFALAAMYGPKYARYGKVTADKVDFQPLHRDETDRADNDEKHIDFLYYETPGAERQPTNFIGTDEVIERMTLSSGMEKQHIVHRLMAMETSWDGQSPLPFLSRNPNYVSGSGAPEYFVSHGRNIIGHVRQNYSGSDGELIDLYAQCADQLAREQNETSHCGIEANTLAIFNDGLLHHARGATEEYRPQRGRTIRVLSAYPTVYKPVSQALSVAHVTASLASPTTGPSARIDLSSRPEWEAALPPNMRGGRS